MRPYYAGYYKAGYLPLVVTRAGDAYLKRDWMGTQVRSVPGRSVGPSVSRTVYPAKAGHLADVRKIACSPIEFLLAF